MKPWIAALALAAAPVCSFAEEGKTSLDDRFFKAFYQEAGLRDFGKAAALYAEVAEAARAAKDPGMEAKALLGRARCLKVSGKKEEARAEVTACLALEPENEEAKGIRASLEAPGAPAGEDSALEERCQTLLAWLADEDPISARREFGLLGARGLPYLEKALRYRALEYVEGAAHLLATGTIPGGLEALRRAIADPDVPYSRVLCDAVLGVDSPDLPRRARTEDIPLLEAVARRAEPALRRGVVQRLVEANLGADPRAVALVRALAADPDLEVRLVLIGSDWSPSYWKEVGPVVVAALKSGVAAERAAAAGAVKRDPDLLRSAAGDLRALLEDPDAAVRRSVFSTLDEVDGLGQADLAALLADADGDLVRAAGERLREVSPWEKGVAESVRGALRKALLAQVPAGGIESVLAFISADPRPGGLAVDDLVALFIQSWSPEQRLGSRAASEVRGTILGAIGNRFASDEEAKRCVLRGLREIPSPDGLFQWMVQWTQESGYRSVEIGIAAAASEDPRIRAAGYRCLAACPAAPDPRAVTAALRRLSEDLLGGASDLQEAAMQVATVYPDPVSVEAIRKHHAAASGVERGGLLATLVMAAGKGAEAEVREDLASKDPSVRHAALVALFGGLGATDFEEIRNYLKGGGTPAEVASLWFGAASVRPTVGLLRQFLGEVGPARADRTVLRSASLLPVAERNQFLTGVLQHPDPGMRREAASLVETWRALDCVKALSALLDDPDVNVQNAAATALQGLNTYLQRKAAAARLLDGPAVDPMDAARDLLRSPDPEKRRGAILAMGALQDRAAIPLLLKALDDPDPAVKAAALSVLERMGASLK